MSNSGATTTEPGDPELMAVAERASHFAYAPYSRFYVGAAVRTVSGKIYEGANFENGSYGATVCAERAAVGHALVHENHRGRGITIVRVAVFARTRKKLQPRTASPCGICRQVIYELGRDAVVEFLENRAFTSKRVLDLLPDPFELESTSLVSRG